MLTERGIHIRKRYSDREKAEALAIFDACGTLTETARVTGIPTSTLNPWILAQRGVNPDISLLRQGKQLDTVDLAAKFDRIAHLATSHVISRLEDPKKANKVQIPHLMTAAGIATDKMQLLRGQPTSITEERVSGGAVLALLAGALGFEGEKNVTPTEAKSANLLEEMAPAHRVDTVSEAGGDSATL